MTLRDELRQIADQAPGADVPDDTWAHAQRSRRSDRSVALAGGVAVVALAAGVGAWLSTSGEPPVPSRDAAAPSSSDGPHHPTADRVQVTCTNEGIELDKRTIAAQPGGVVLVVSSSMPKGSYLAYISDGGGQSGGDRMPADPTTWTLGLAPGDLTLTCAPPGDVEPGPAGHVQVTDPHGYWRGESLADLECTPGALPSWIGGLGGTGDTPEQAVDQVLANFTHLAPATYSAQPAEIGYVDAATQTWVATKNGRPDMTIEVTRMDTRFSAGPERTCGPT